MKSGFWQLIGHEHTGRLRHHAHTSYSSLLFVLLVVFVLLASFSIAAEGATPAVNPQQGSIGLTGTVPGPAPKTAASIASPRNGQHTSSIPITITGTCPVSTFVIITKNNSFAGATDCKADNTYTLQVDLFAGANQLVARVSDALGQYGPDSLPVTVYYDAPSTGFVSSVAGKQLFLQSATSVMAASPGVPITRTITIVGGVGPYAVSWDWGDGATSLATQSFEGAASAKHSYDRAGYYRVIVRVTDSQQNSAYLELVNVANGPTNALGSASSSKSVIAGSLLAAWPIFILALIMVVFFWLGERRQDRKLRLAQQQEQQGV